MSRVTGADAWRQLAAVLAVSCVVTSAWAQTLTPRVSAAAIQVKAAAVGIIQGDVLQRLRDGRSLRLDLALDVAADRGGPSVARVAESFTLSFDLWEERFAVTRIGTPKRSASHLGASDAEAWCIDQLSIPRATVTSIGRGGTFWLRLEYRVPDDPVPADGDGFSLRTLIDSFSRRPRAASGSRVVDAGPFRLSD